MNFIKDEEFIRGNCPMTKEEIRILVIAKMGLKNTDKVLDIGAGTGSISIQASKLAKNVVAIEKDSEALEVIYKNKDKFKAHNLSVIEGEALEVALSIKEEFDVVFVGGSDGNIKQILRTYTNKVKQSGKIVLTFITIENLYIAHKTLKSLGYTVECTQVQVSKARGNGLMLFGQNPIFILSACKE